MSDHDKNCLMSTDIIYELNSIDNTAQIAYRPRITNTNDPEDELSVALSSSNISLNQVVVVLCLTSFPPRNGKYLRQTFVIEFHPKPMGTIPLPRCTVEGECNITGPYDGFPPLLSIGLQGEELPRFSIDPSYMTNGTLWNEYANIAKQYTKYQWFTCDCRHFAVEFMNTVMHSHEEHLTLEVINDWVPFVLPICNADKRCSEDDIVETCKKKRKVLSDKNNSR